MQKRSRVVSPRSPCEANESGAKIPAVLAADLSDSDDHSNDHSTPPAKRTITNNAPMQATAEVANENAPQPMIAAHQVAAHPQSPASNRDRFRAALMPAQITCDLSSANPDPGMRFSFQAIVIVIFPASQSPVRRHVLVADGRGVVGVTVWNAHVAAFSVSTVGQMVRITKVSLSSHNGTRGIMLNKESTLTFGEDNDHFAHHWWQGLTQQRPLQAIDFADAKDGSIVNVTGILGSVHVESKTVRCDAKELLTLRLVDRTGITQIRSWNHVADQFVGRIDHPIMISRVRVTSFGGLKIGELLDGTGSIIHQSGFPGSEDLAKFWCE